MSALFRFRGKYVLGPADSHYPTLWARANTVSVLAKDTDEATKKFRAMVGEAQRGYTWRLSWESVDEETPAGKDQS